MARRTYERQERTTLLFKTPYTQWLVRNERGYLLGRIVQTDAGFEVYSGHYDMNDNFICSSSAAIRPTYRKAQAFFR